MEVQLSRPGLLPRGTPVPPSVWEHSEKMSPPDANVPGRTQTSIPQSGTEFRCLRPPGWCTAFCCSSPSRRRCWPKQGAVVVTVALVLVNSACVTSCQTPLSSSCLLSQRRSCHMAMRWPPVTLPLTVVPQVCWQPRFSGSPSWGRDNTDPGRPCSASGFTNTCDAHWRNQFILKKKIKKPCDL